MPELAQAGITSFKIEGRMKSIHYIASIVSFYRQVIDGKIFTQEQGFELLSRVPNRGYSYGFMKGSIGPEDYKFNQSLSHCGAVFVGNILEKQIDNGSILEVRNKIYAGETLEVLTPDGSLSNITLPQSLAATDNQQCEFANNSQFIKIDRVLPPYSVLRRISR